MDPPPPTSTEVAQWITRHLAENPRAADTAEGIQRWWLAPRHGEVALAVVAEALTELEREGVVSRDSIGSQVVWHLAPRTGPGA